MDNPEELNRLNALSSLRLDELNQAIENAKVNDIPAHELHMKMQLFDCVTEKIHDKMNGGMPPKITLDIDTSEFTEAVNKLLKMQKRFEGVIKKKVFTFPNYIEAEHISWDDVDPVSDISKAVEARKNMGMDFVDNSKDKSAVIIIESARSKPKTLMVTHKVYEKFICYCENNRLDPENILASLSQFTGGPAPKLEKFELPEIEVYQYNSFPELKEMRNERKQDAFHNKNIVTRSGGRKHKKNPFMRNYRK